jgi:hypothetical protein
VDLGEQALGVKALVEEPPVALGDNQCVTQGKFAPWVKSENLSDAQSTTSGTKASGPIDFCFALSQVQNAGRRTDEYAKRRDGPLALVPKLRLGTHVFETPFRLPQAQSSPPLSVQADPRSCVRRNSANAPDHRRSALDRIDVQVFQLL